MKFVNIFINGLKMPLPVKSSVWNVLERFFNLQCEFLACINSKPIATNCFHSTFIRENDELQIVSYSEHTYPPRKRTYMNDGEE